MALRYFGAEGGEAYYKDVSQSENWKSDIWVCIKPERWLTVDYSKLGPPPK
jgi:hypothetical protein